MAFAACQPSQALDAAPTEPKAPKLQVAAKVVAAKSAPKHAVATANAKTPDVATAAAKQNDAESVMTTVTGCLELRDDGMFQLKDTDGEHAPKSRNWKSGFIKKGTAKVNVFDGGNRLKLGTHVGYRVSISGTLTDRELRARSLRATSEACE
jgi:hypothetical protein